MTETTKSRGVSRATYYAIPAALVGPSLLAWYWSSAAEGAFLLPREIAFQALYCGLAAIVLWVIVARERLGLGSVGLRRPTLSTLLLAALIYGAGVVLQYLTAPLGAFVGTEAVGRAVGQLAMAPPAFRITLAVTGGVIEEFLYRGYAIERLSTISRSPWFAATASTTVFALAHIPLWGVGYSLIVVLPFGIMMAAFYLWRRDLAANMIAHSAGLVVAMITIVP